MNWVWEHSSAAGGDLLVLLAIADHASDDGTHAFPTVDTLAGKCRMSARSVQRAIGRLAELGELRVERNAGGLARTPAYWRPNSYTVVMPEPVENPDRGDRLSPPEPVENAGRGDSAVTPGGDTGDTRGGDTAVTQNRPNQPSRTATPGSSDPNPVEPDPVEPDGGDGTAPARQFFDALGQSWRLSPRQRRRLTPRIGQALDAGWDPAELAAHVGANTAGVRNAYAVLSSRLADLPDPPAPSRTPRRPPWCGHCHHDTRLREDEHGRPSRCPACHPSRAARTDGERAPASRTPEAGRDGSGQPGPPSPHVTSAPP